MTAEDVADIGRDGEACDQPGATRAPYARRTMPVRRRALRGGGRIRLRRELPLRRLPARDRLGVQAVRRHRARQAAHHRRRGPPHDFRRRQWPRRALPGVRFAALFGGARRRLRPRRHGHPGRRPGHPPEQAHLRRLQGAVVHHHRRSAAIRRACGGRRVRAARHRDGRLPYARASFRARDHSSSADASRTPARQRGAESSATEACDA